ncbi:hypothetical protein BER2_3843 [plant metagenome]|uniref:Uncharacterized protein n=1 Tax=plant metagenome TaxID=1297885 RepID=A0A484Q811_9ZZZZ
MGKGLQGVDAEAVVKDDQRVAVNDNLDSRGATSVLRQLNEHGVWGEGGTS